MCGGGGVCVWCGCVCVCVCVRECVCVVGVWWCGVRVCLREKYVCVSCEV